MASASGRPKRVSKEIDAETLVSGTTVSVPQEIIERACMPAITAFCCITCFFILQDAFLKDVLFVEYFNAFLSLPVSLSLREGAYPT